MKSSAILALAGSLVTASVLEVRNSTWTVGQTVQTSSGPVAGHPASNNSLVSEYLGIPYGQSPTGDLRFAAPVKFTGSAALNGSSFVSLDRIREALLLTIYQGYSCPVKNSPMSAPTAAEIDAANVTVAGALTLSLLSNSKGVYSEDCLNLNVWTKPQTGDAKKAVLVWIYGGGFTSGSSATAGYNGQNLAGQEDVVVVSLK